MNRFPKKADERVFTVHSGSATCRDCGEFRVVHSGSYDEHEDSSVVWLDDAVCDECFDKVCDREWSLGSDA